MHTITEMFVYLWIRFVARMGGTELGNKEKEKALSAHRHVL